MVPEQLRYTSEHEWVEPVGDDGTLRMGITHYAQDALGDIVFLQLPEPGAEVTAGEPLGEIESTKSVSELYAPVSGRVVEVNEAATAHPEIINSDPYGEGWLLKITPADANAVNDLLDADAYRQLTQS